MGHFFSIVLLGSKLKIYIFLSYRIAEYSWNILITTTNFLFLNETFSIIKHLPSSTWLISHYHNYLNLKVLEIL